MAKVMSTIFHRNNSYFLNLLRHSNTHQTLYKVPVCYLYAKSTLGVDGYLQSREKLQHQFKDMTDRFRTKMQDYANDENNKNMIFTEDLKNIVHLVETDDDVSLVVQMMKKFNNQNKELRFGNFVFGPVVMRMFHYLNKPNEAIECFTSPQLEGFFDQLMSYQLLLDLLYENKRYDDVIKIFEIIKNKQIQGTKYPKNIIVLTMATCYKQNTPESFKYALDLWKELNEVGHVPMRRAITFCAGLALNQGKPEAALEIIAASRHQMYMTIRNIKITALCQVNRVEDCLPILRNVLEVDTKQLTKHTFSKDVIENVLKSAVNLTAEDTKHELTRIEKCLREQGHITDTVLDELLCKEISAPAYIGAKKTLQDKSLPRKYYQGKERSSYRVFNNRPGLQDMN